VLSRSASVAVALAAATGVGMLAGPAAALPLPTIEIVNPDPETDPGGDLPVVDAENEGGSVTVRIEVAGSTVEGQTFTTASVRSVAPRCWYGRGMSGYDYFEYWKVGGVARESDTLDDYAYQGLLNPNFEEYATETEGAWYEPGCRSDVPVEERVAYVGAHPAVYVRPQEPVPVQPAQVDPEVLAQVAFEAMDLPTGEVRWNPQLPGSGATVVNLDTWVWVEGAPVSVAVTASVDSGQWARVDAQLEELTVTAPGADPASCPDAGTPWTAGATSTSCAVTFFRSSANQPVKAGHEVPTATMTITTRWAASWVSSAGGAPTGLPDQELTTTTEIPVAEIQAIVTRG
jgi:hypothetical protein